MTTKMERTTHTERVKHLTSAQLDGLLFADAVSTAEPSAVDEAAAQHLHACAACAAELVELRDSLGLLREAATAYAGQKTALASRVFAAAAIGPTAIGPTAFGPRRGTFWTATAELGSWRLPRVPAYCALAASLALAAAMIPSLPLSLHGGHKAVAPFAKAPDRSLADDEALLQAIDQQLSASVPTALEPLADPAKSSTAPTISNDTKKD